MTMTTTNFEARRFRRRHKITGEAVSPMQLDKL